MDKILSETLLDVIEMIGRRNVFTGYKIHSFGSRTNIVIHFLESSNALTNQSSETVGNGQLKSSSTFSKKRSPCNEIRDLKRVREHVKVNFISQPNLDSTVGQSQHDQDCKQDTCITTQEQDSGISPNFDFSSDPQDDETGKTDQNQDSVEADNTADSHSQTEQCEDINSQSDKCENLDSQNDSAFDRKSGTKSKTSKPSRGRFWHHSPTNWQEYDCDQYDSMYDYRGGYRYLRPYARRYPPLSALFKRNSRYGDYT